MACLLRLSTPAIHPAHAVQVGMRIALSCVLLGRGEFLAAQVS